MKLPELLKLAVEEQDWLKVCAVYTAITGKPLSPPKKKVSLLELEIPEDLLANIEATRNDEDDDEDEYGEFPDIPSEPDEEAEESLIVDVNPEPVEVEDSKKKEEHSEFAISHGVQTQTNADGKTIMRKVPMTGIANRPNKFRDNLAVEAGDLKKNNPILKKVYSKAGTRASRDLIDAPDTSKKINVVCSLCEKPQSVTLVMARGWNKDKEQNTYRCTECDTPSGRARVARRNRDLGVYDG